MVCHEFSLSGLLGEYDRSLDSIFGAIPFLARYIDCSTFCTVSGTSRQVDLGEEGWVSIIECCVIEDGLLRFYRVIIFVFFTDRRFTRVRVGVEA